MIFLFPAASALAGEFFTTVPAGKPIYIFNQSRLNISWIYWIEWIYWRLNISSRVNPSNIASLKMSGGGIITYTLILSIYLKYLALEKGDWHFCWDHVKFINYLHDVEFFHLRTWFSLFICCSLSCVFQWKCFQNFLYINFACFPLGSWLDILPFMLLA